jgi:hypothetical protein
LSNTIRNAVNVGMSQNRLDTIQHDLKVFRDFGDAHSIVAVIDNRIYRQSRTAQQMSAALHARLDVNDFSSVAVDTSFTAIPCFCPKGPRRLGCVHAAWANSRESSAIVLGRFDRLCDMGYARYARRPRASRPSRAVRV